MCLNDSLCCNCLTKKCEWMYKDKPVEGWQAEKTKNGYHVSECPKYIAPIAFIGDNQKKKLKTVMNKLRDKDLTKQEYRQLMSIAEAVVKRLEAEK